MSLADQPREISTSRNILQSRRLGNTMAGPQLHLTEKLHDPYECQLVVGACGRDCHDGCGLCLVLAFAVRASLDDCHGLRENKAKLEEMRKSAGKSYALSFVASLFSAFILAKIINA